MVWSQKVKSKRSLKLNNSNLRIQMDLERRPSSWMSHFRPTQAENKAKTDGHVYFHNIVGKANALNSMIPMEKHEPIAGIPVHCTNSVSSVYDREYFSECLATSDRYFESVQNRISSEKVTCIVQCSGRGWFLQVFTSPSRFYLH